MRRCLIGLILLSHAIKYFLGKPSQIHFAMEMHPLKLDTAKPVGNSGIYVASHKKEMIDHGIDNGNKHCDELTPTRYPSPT